MPPSIVPDLAPLARLTEPLVTRFAPSPTGYLHLGHVVNAIYTWGIARAAGAQVLLRIEDHDRRRCRPEYDRAMLDDLAWLGFSADAPALRQSDDPDIYAQALAQLRAAHHVFACDCSRKDLAGEREAEQRYRGRCRERRLGEGLEEQAGTGLRVVIGPGTEAFTDLRLGDGEQEPAAQCGDVLLRDRDGHWTYQFAVTVDDWRQKINLVIRGEDLLSSTGRQLRLGRMLGRERPPLYVHHPLLVSPSGVKLSKANRDIGITDLRATGLPAEEVIGRAAAAAGLLDTARPLAAGEVHELFRGATGAPVP